METKSRRPAWRLARSVRKRFLERHADLLAQIDAAREAGIYSLFPRLAPGRPGEAGPVVLATNDYLGLAADPGVRRAAQEAIERYGTSRSASPLAGGYTDLHQAFEHEIARFLRRDAAVLFASGYQANVGTISALVGPGDLVLTDLFDHASIIDGARLSGAELRFFQHNSATHLRRLLEREAAGRTALVVVEGVYSADGDIVALPEILKVAHGAGALVAIDEAHSLGVLGPEGQGAAARFGLLEEVDLVIGTMSKSLASIGGFVAADRRIVEIIRHRARALVFSASIAPANVAAARAALAVLRSDEERRSRLWRNTELALGYLERCGFDTMGSQSPVIPLLVGEPTATLQLAARLAAEGIIVCPAIPPMVPAARSRIRLHVSAAHDPAVLRRALERIAVLAAEVGAPKTPRPRLRRATASG